MEKAQGSLINPGTKSTGCELEVAPATKVQGSGPGFQGNSGTGGRAKSFYPYMTLFLVGLLWTTPVLAARVMLSEAPSAMFCPQGLGISRMALPEVYQCNEFLQELVAYEGQVYMQTIQMHLKNTIWARTNASVCSCETRYVYILQDALSRKRYLRFESEKHVVTKSQCYHMDKDKESPAGPLYWTGYGWGTNNSLEWKQPLPFVECCHWIKHSTQNCYITFTPLHARNPGNLESPLVSLPDECSYDMAYKRGNCPLKDGRFMQWKPNMSDDFQCYYPNDRNQTGYLLTHPNGYSYWVNTEGSLVLSFYTAVPRTQSTCTGRTVELFGDILGTSFILLDQSNSLKTMDGFRSLFAVACRQMQQTVDKFKVSIRNQPDFQIRATMGRPNLTAIVQGQLLMIRSCITLGPHDYSLLPMKNFHQTGLIPLEFAMQKVWYRGFLDPQTRVVHPTSELQPWILPSMLEKLWKEWEIPALFYAVDLFQDYTPAGTWG